MTKKEARKKAKEKIMKSIYRQVDVLFNQAHDITEQIKQVMEYYTMYDALAELYKKSKDKKDKELACQYFEKAKTYKEMYNDLINKRAELYEIIFALSCAKITFNKDNYMYMKGMKI